MKPFIIGINPKVFEFLNFSIGMLCLAMSFILIRYLVVEYRSGHLDPPEIYGPRHSMALAWACALDGEALIRLWTWYARFAANIGVDVSWMDHWFSQIAPVSFSAIECAGLVGCMRVFAPEEWRYYSWGTLAFILTLSALRYYFI